jgi:hypothetical protein
MSQVVTTDHVLTLATYIQKRIAPSGHSTQFSDRDIYICSLGILNRWAQFIEENQSTVSLSTILENVILWSGGDLETCGRELILAATQVDLVLTTERLGASEKIQFLEKLRQALLDSNRISYTAAAKTITGLGGGAAAIAALQRNDLWQWLSGKYADPIVAKFCSEVMEDLQKKKWPKIPRSLAVLLSTRFGACKLARSIGREQMRR